MRAALLDGHGQDFRLGDIPTPEPGPGEVLVRVAGAGLCHSDLLVRNGTLAGLPASVPPWILGHETAGYIDTLGVGVTGLEIGEPVAVFGGWGCGICRFCVRGEEQLCDILRWGGLGPRGGFAEYLLVPAARHLVQLGELDPVVAAPLTDAGLTPYRAVKKALPRLVPGSTAVVIGAGGLGQFAIQYLRLLTASRIVAIDTNEAKRTTATSYGADHVIDPAATKSDAEIRAMTRGEGATIVLDFVGSDATLALALSLIARQGTVVIVGLEGGAARLTHNTAGEATVTASVWGTRSELAEVVALAASGAITVTVDQFALTDINTAAERLRKGEVPGRAVIVPRLG